MLQLPNIDMTYLWLLSLWRNHEKVSKSQIPQKDEFSIP